MHRLLVVSGLSALVAGCGDARAAREADRPQPLPPAVAPSGGGAFVGRELVDSGLTYRYQIFVPRAAVAGARPPVIVYLHGNSEKGTDGDRQTRAGLGPVVRAQAATFPAVVVFPQSLVGSYPRIHRTFGRVVLRMLDSAMAEFHGDPDRVYLTGISFGSVIGYELVYDEPTRFAAFVPVATKNPCCILDQIGGDLTRVDTALVQRLRRLPIWQQKGGADTIGSLVGMHNFIAAMRAEGAPIRYTEYPGRGHEVWDTTYADSALYTWLFAQRRARKP